MPRKKQLFQETKLIVPEAIDVPVLARTIGCKPDHVALAFHAIYRHMERNGTDWVMIDRDSLRRFYRHLDDIMSALEGAGVIAINRYYAPSRKTARSYQIIVPINPILYTMTDTKAIKSYSAAVQRYLHPEAGKEAETLTTIHRLMKVRNISVGTISPLQVTSRNNQPTSNPEKEQSAHFKQAEGTISPHINNNTTLNDTTVENVHSDKLDKERTETEGRMNIPEEWQAEFDSIFS